MREQGSTFRVNGREVRARDVNVLFADASTGSRSPALVHQGRIGEIIQARPDQRRRLLEEAAGISGLHVRRHEAELRLKAAEHNLARVEDVIGQLAAQVASLKTQARQAVRYRNISSQVRRTEALLLHLRWTAAKLETAEAERTKDEAVRVVAERTSEQTIATTKQAEVAAELPGLREAEARAAATLQRLLVARDALEREEALAKERIAELDRRLAQYAAICSASAPLPPMPPPRWNGSTPRRRRSRPKRRRAPRNWAASTTALPPRKRHSRLPKKPSSN